MPEPTGGLATVFYWAMTDGKLPADDLKDEDDDAEREPEDKDPETQKVKKGR